MKYLMGHHPPILWVREKSLTRMLPELHSVLCLRGQLVQGLESEKQKSERPVTSVGLARIWQERKISIFCLLKIQFHSPFFSRLHGGPALLESIPNLGAQSLTQQIMSFCHLLLPLLVFTELQHSQGSIHSTPLDKIIRNTLSSAWTTSGAHLNVN